MPRTPCPVPPPLRRLWVRVRITLGSPSVYTIAEILRFLHCLLLILPLAVFVWLCGSLQCLFLLQGERKSCALFLTVVRGCVGSGSLQAWFVLEGACNGAHRYVLRVATPLFAPYPPPPSLPTTWNE